MVVETIRLLTSFQSPMGDSIFHILITGMVAKFVWVIVHLSLYISIETVNLSVFNDQAGFRFGQAKVLSRVGPQHQMGQAVRWSTRQIPLISSGVSPADVTKDSSLMGYASDTHHIWIPR